MVANRADRGSRAGSHPTAADTPLVPRMREFGTTIFAEMTARATALGAINLGQGFPDTDGPTAMLDEAVAAIRRGDNQYAPGPGIPALRTAIAAHQCRHYDLSPDPDTGVLVTAGATEAIAATLLALVQPGDEVVMFEPYYDSYAAGIALAGAARRVVTLDAPNFTFSAEALHAAITPRTRVLLLNSPHNPTGKVFSASELAIVAEVARAHDLVVVTDEVYEHIVHDGEHIPIATLPGMWDRTVTISSAGKTYSCTGWKIGWATGPEPLITAVRTVKQFLTYTNGTPFQHAVALALETGTDFVVEQQRQLERKRDALSAGLRAAGFTVFESAGTYFVTVDIASLSERDGLEFCRTTLPERAGVVAVPTEVFYDHPDAGRSLVRFAYCKRDDVIADACARLSRLGVPGAAEASA